MNKQLSDKSNLVVICIIAVMMQLAFTGAQAKGQLRKIKIGDKMPEFSLIDDGGAVYTYKHERKVLVLLFVSEQKQSKLAITGIEDILNEYEDKSERFGFAAVINEPNNGDLLEYLKIQSRGNYHILTDEKFELWGKLGLIAMPTAVIMNKSGEVTWIRAGYGYDFVPAVKQNLGLALGMNGHTDQVTTEVKTLVHDQIPSKIMRHLRMAKMLEERGRTESAIKEVSKAIELDPNSVSAVLAMGLLHCKTGKSQDAINVVAKLEPELKSQKAELNLVLGWANRQLPDLDKAQEFLLEAVKLNPESARSFYELGKTYQAKGDIEKAATAYHKALAITFHEPE
ncbi:MAG: tetratricopeptide repeat protein [Planctomycetota bacterium]